MYHNEAEAIIIVFLVIMRYIDGKVFTVMLVLCEAVLTYHRD